MCKLRGIGCNSISQTHFVIYPNETDFIILQTLLKEVNAFHSESELEVKLTLTVMVLIFNPACFGYLYFDSVF